MTSRALAVVLLIAMAGGARLFAQSGADLDAPMAAIEIDGETLFAVRGVSSMPAPERAAAIRARIIAVAADRAVAIESIHAAPAGDGYRVLAGDRLLMAVVEADAALEQVGAADLAGTHAQRIRQAVAEYRSARLPAALERDAFNILLATIALAAALVFVIWLTRRIDRFLTRRLQSRIKTVGIQSFEVMRAERIWDALHSFIAAMRTIFIAIVALLYIGYVLSQLPWTRGVSRDMSTLALAPLQTISAGIVANIPSLIFLAVLYFLGRVVLRLTRLFFDAIGRGTVRLSNFDPDWAEPTYKIVRLLIVAFGLIVAYPYIPGSESAAFKGVSLFIGVVFSLGSSSAISNIVAGYMITYRRAFKTGDRIRVGTAFGDVTQTRLQVTHLRSLKNEEIVIPNSQLLGAEVVNYSSLSRTDGLILHTEVGIGYETPWRQVEAMLLMAAERTSGLSPEPRPFILHKKLGDFAVIYELNAATKDVGAMVATYSDLHRNILDVFNEYGVQIMTPAYVHDPDVPKIVPRKDWHLPPAAAAGGHSASGGAGVA
jgi:small-conductance mechanosensitive channel